MKIALVLVFRLLNENFYYLDGLDEGLELGWHEGIDDGCLYDKWR